MCGAGVNVGSVLADGSISACPSIRSDYSQGNIYKDDFLEVWKNGYNEYRDRSWMRKINAGIASTGSTAEETGCISATRKASSFSALPVKCQEINQ